MMTIATTTPKPAVVPGSVRAFRQCDIEAVAKLYDRAFLQGPGRRRPRLEAYLREIFFDAPCQVAGDLHSHVYEDNSGLVGGFLGTHPRRFVFEGQPIIAAACGQLMVHPDLQGQGIARRLCERFYEGPQDFSFHGTASRTRTIHLRLGAHNPSFYGLSWRKLLRPGRRFARRLSESRRLGMLRHLAAPFVSQPFGHRDAKKHSLPKPGESNNTSTDGSGCIRNPAGAKARGLDLWNSLSEIETIHRRASEGCKLYPAFDARDLEWKLQMIMASDRPGTFACVVRQGQEPIGWYVWLLDADGTGIVVEMLASPHCHERVLTHLLSDARKRGAESIGGYCADTPEAIAVQSVGASLRFARSTYIIHSRKPELVRLFLDEPPRLSVFDGEGWFDFPTQ